MTLRGQRIVALGGTSGIGLAVVQSVLTEGARVVVAAVTSGTVDIIVLMRHRIEIQQCI